MISTSLTAKALVALLSAFPASAWIPSSSTNKQRNYPTALHMDIKAVGGGIPVVPSGGRQLFDPAAEGMLGQDTTNLEERLQQGSNFHWKSKQDAELASLISSPTLLTTNKPYLPDETTPAASEPPVDVITYDAQHWLEGTAVDGSPFAKNSKPVTATVLGRAKLIDDDAPGDIEHIVLKLPDGMHYLEGQSLAVIPPGYRDNGKPHKPRLYSIASTRYGDILDGKTVSLCVRRAEYTDPATGLVDPSKAGICSNFLCDATPGTTVQVAGPVGKTMLLPEDPDTDIIMVATGTGMAPFRGFLHRLFMEQTVARHQFAGTAWLVLGVPTTGSLLYREEIEAMQAGAAAAGNLEVDFAISREQKNIIDGGKRYVQHVLQEPANAEKLWDRLENGAHVYICGLKGMLPGIVSALEQVAAARGVNWDDRLKQLKANGQWHVEVY